MVSASSYELISNIGKIPDQFEVSWLKITEVVIKSIKELRLGILKSLEEVWLIQDKSDTHVSLQDINAHWDKPYPNLSAVRSRTKSDIYIVQDFGG